ncbi:DegT/DnrJ/EryC1/StrS aminotransferase family protein [Hydrogenovibrio sp. SC-1]|uniref:DegT/DnrJ/EryC1/StrS family aminotransferase n=1 Tax=Hydrogenovibrio sp. SC-1 TaxID=2065820 RepID=UPI001E2ED927|nr:DegT/DnrJ/EryC1/StrS family aminotransferase [Hydrogenovibrio sp. SC-1]
MGEQVSEFEKLIKNYLDTQFDVICVSTGTSALHLALECLGLSAGDEVLVPSLTYVASFQAISATGAVPISCEVNPTTLFLDINDAEQKITKRTKVIMPVHYASSSKGMEEVYDLATKYNLRVVEDAAQAFGCSRQGEKVGVSGDVICFSFDGIKNITSGEGGAIVTGDTTLADKLKDSRLLGVKKDTEKRYLGQRSWDFDVEFQGFRYHMSNVHAAIGIEQLNRIEEFKTKRQLIVFKYLSDLLEIKQVEILDFNYDELISHIFVIKVEQRNALRDFLLASGIECGIHYKPNHLLTKYECNCCLPVTEQLYTKILTLPCHVDFTEDEQEYVITKIREFYEA